jgi:hypothetical protein
MIKTLEIGLETMEYTYKISVRSKSMRISIDRQGIVTVTVPYGVREKNAEEFVSKKSAWIVDTLTKIRKSPQAVVVKHTAQEIRTYKKEAQEFVLLRLAFFNQFYSFTWKNISIKNTTSRWGSCSKQGNLNFSYKVVLLSKVMADYIVVHELCHLGEFNHSSSFWKLVERTIPNYREIRRELKKIAL